MDKIGTDSDLISMPVSYEGNGRAAVMMLVDDDLKQMIYEAASEGVARTFEIWDSTNILALGCDLAIINPYLLDEEEWNQLCEVFGSYIDVNFRMLLTRQSPYSSTMPRRNIISAPAQVTVQYLREQMLRASVIPDRKQIWRKKERQIVRLMYMLRCLDTSELRLRNVADRFEISLRTAQRDLEVLLAADYCIEDGDEPGVYRFPKDYKSHYAYYDSDGYSYNTRG